LTLAALFALLSSQVLTCRPHNIRSYNQSVLDVHYKFLALSKS